MNKSDERLLKAIRQKQSVWTLWDNKTKQKVKAFEYLAKIKLSEGSRYKLLSKS